MTDVAIYGATACGVAAAVTAAEAGCTTVLVEPGRHVGGMVSGGLGWTDVGDRRAIGGFARRFFAAVADWYGAPLWAVKGPEPHVAEALLLGFLERAGVALELETRALPPAAVTVDATYEGDVLAARGISYAVGREDRALHGERWAGRQPAYRPGKHNFAALVSPFAADGSLLAHVSPPTLDGEGWPEERLGEGDGALQAYQYRLCLTDRPDARIPVDRPSDYDPAEFEVFRRYLHAMGDRLTTRALIGLEPSVLPNGKCDVNSIGPFSLNLLDGSNRAYPDGDDHVRAAIRARHLRHAQALLWFLGEDESVPTAIRKEVRAWGLCPDEFLDTDGWPHQLYVRDGRRMRGAVVLTERDVLGAAPRDDVVALGSYNIDLREIERTWRYLPEYDRTPAVFNEGYLSLAVRPYPIPYGVLTPRREEATDVLVPVCLSASHVAFGSVRTEPTLMALGHAAGAAAALAARAGIPVQDVEVPELQDRLRSEGQALAT